MIQVIDAMDGVYFLATETFDSDPELPDEPGLGLKASTDCVAVTTEGSWEDVTLLVLLDDNPPTEEELASGWDWSAREETTFEGPVSVLDMEFAPQARVTESGGTFSVLVAARRKSTVEGLRFRNSDPPTEEHMIILTPLDRGGGLH